MSKNAYVPVGKITFSVELFLWSAYDEYRSIIQRSQSYRCAFWTPPILYYSILCYILLHCTLSLCYTTIVHYKLDIVWILIGFTSSDLHLMSLVRLNYFNTYQAKENVYWRIPLSCAPWFSCFCYHLFIFYYMKFMKHVASADSGCFKFL